MRILGRYILRLHLGPFLFSLCALTLLLLLDQVAKKLERLVGRDLGGSVIVEVFLYSIPFILAVIVPMAVLVAVLYVFNQLAADNEIAAMKASGISLFRLMLPVLAASTLIAGGMVWFNDVVLPESNHHLARLLVDISRKKPTFGLNEQLINEVSPGRLFIRAARIDPATNALQDVTIFDERDPDHSRTIYADSGTMALTSTDLLLTLHHGVMNELQADNDTTYQRVAFAISYMRIPDVANELQRDSQGAYRSDRELPIGEMRDRAATNRKEALTVSTTSRGLTLGITAKHLGGLVDIRSLAPEPPSAEADDDDSGDDEADSADSIAADQARQLYTAVQTGSGYTRPASAVNAFRVQATRYKTYQESANRYDVEIQKKLAIPAACIVFVLIGAPFGVQYRRGGVGLVIGVSLGVFCLYYMALIAGEGLADRRFLSPFWAMWAPNVLFGGLGIAALVRQSRAGA